MAGWGGIDRAYVPDRDGAIHLPPLSGNEHSALWAEDSVTDVISTLESVTYEEGAFVKARTVNPLE